MRIRIYPTEWSNVLNVSQTTLSSNQPHGRNFLFLEMTSLLTVTHLCTVARPFNGTNGLLYVFLICNDRVSIFEINCWRCVVTHSTLVLQMFRNFLCVQSRKNCDAYYQSCADYLQGNANMSDWTVIVLSSRAINVYWKQMNIQALSLHTAQKKGSSRVLFFLCFWCPLIKCGRTKVTPRGISASYLNFADWQ